MTSFIKRIERDDIKEQTAYKRIERDDTHLLTAHDRYLERQRIAQEQHIKREWVGLTKKEFEEAVEGLEDLYDCWAQIEQALKDKNT